MKKTVAFTLITLLCLPGCSLFRRKTGPVEEIRKPTPAPKRTSLKFSEENPYVYLVPRADGHAFNLYAFRFGDTKHLEYELTYKAGAQLQGAIGRFDLKGESVGPEEIVLGTCSKGVCKYDEDVGEGTLTLKFLYKDIREEKVWESDFHLQEIGTGGEEISSKDGKFTLKAPLSSINRSGFVLTMPLLSLPEPLGKTAGGVAYGVFPSPGTKITKGTVSFLFFSPPEDFEKLSIFGWEQEKWVNYKTTADLAKKTLSAPIGIATVFAVAQP